MTLNHIDTQAPCPVLFDTPRRSFYGLLEDEDNLQAVIGSDWHDRPEAPQVQEGDIVLEVGAWLGVFTDRALKNGAKLVVAFEPEPKNIACFKQNFAEEIRTGRVILIEAAAWKSPGPVSLANIGPNNDYRSGKGFAVVENGEVPAQAVTINDTVRRLGLERIDFINMDIEGGERHAFAGATETVSRFAPSIVVCIHHLSDDREVIPEVVLGIRPDYRLETNDLKGYFTRPADPAEGPSPRLKKGPEPPAGRPTP